MPASARGRRRRRALVYPALAPVAAGAAARLAGARRRPGATSAPSRAGRVPRAARLPPRRRPARHPLAHERAARRAAGARERGRARRSRRRSCSTTTREAAARRRAAFERAVSRGGAACAWSCRGAGSRSRSRCAAATFAADVGPAHIARILRALALVAPDAGRCRPARAGARDGARAGRRRARARMSRRAARAAAEVGVRFQVAHKLVTYLLVLAALAALASTRRCPPISAALFLVACALSFARRRRRPRWRRRSIARPAVRVAAPARCSRSSSWRVWRRLPDPDIAPGVRSGAGAAAATSSSTAAATATTSTSARSRSCWCWSRRRIAQHVPVRRGVRGLRRARGAGRSSCFTCAARWRRTTSSSIRRRRPARRSASARILGSRRVVGGSFFVATAGMAAAVFVGRASRSSCWCRASAPASSLGVARMSGSAVGLRRRDGAGPLRHARRRTAHGVALRATLPRLAALRCSRRAGRPPSELYFRGAVYDSYERGRWRAQPPRRAAHGRSRRSTARGSGSRELDERPAAARARWTPPIRQEIEAVGIPASVLFAVDRAARASSCRRPAWAPPARCACCRAGRARAALRVGEGDGDTFITLRTPTTPRYSRPGAPPRRRPGARPRCRPRARAAYLAVPADVASRIAALGAKLAADAPRRRRQGRGDDGGLRAGHGYTRDPRRRRPASIRSKTSCSASAPATASCSRRRRCCCCAWRGVPARYVTGFRGGDWNGVGGYVAVRDDRAHAWAEAFLPDAGWVRVDATPAGPAPARAGRAVAQLMDALDYFWNRWVVGYDLGRQLELARRAGRHLGPATPRGPSLAHRGCWRSPASWRRWRWRWSSRRLLRRRGRAHRRRDARAGRRRTDGAPVGPGRSPVPQDARAPRPRRLAAPAERDAARVRARACARRAWSPGDGFDRLTDATRRRASAATSWTTGDVAELSAKLAIRPPSAGHPGSAGTPATPLTTRPPSATGRGTDLAVICRPMLRTWLVLLAAALAVALLEPSSAATSLGGSSARARAAASPRARRRRLLHRRAGRAGANLSDFDVARFFNKARCDCDDAVFSTSRYSQRHRQEGDVAADGHDIVLGRPTCDQYTLLGLEQRCQRLDSVQFSDFLPQLAPDDRFDARVLSADTLGGRPSTAASTGVHFTDPTCTLSNEYLRTDHLGHPRQQQRRYPGRRRYPSASPSISTRRRRPIRRRYRPREATRRSSCSGKAST